jgi:metallo-beta-lactamase class B
MTIKSILPIQISSILTSFLFVVALHAQPPASAPSKPDSADVKKDIDKAKKTAGTEWAAEAHFFCEAPRANSLNDPLLEPARIFDNVYILGRIGTAVYAITTSAGIMLIDSGYPNEVEPVVIGGMKKLGLDPAQIKMVILTHGHADHFGGTPFIQEHYGPHVYLSAADWNLMENPPPGRAQKGPPPVLPKHDMLITEGQPILLGDEKVMPVAIPGHTPGAMGLIFAVKDGGKTHMAALYGGTILLPGIISDDGLEQYLHSIAHFKDETKKAKVDVELQNHPLYDGTLEKLEKIQARKKGDPNPFIVGQANYQKFLDVMSQCMDAQIARRKE